MNFTCGNVISSLGTAWSNAAVAGCEEGIARSVEEDFVAAADVAADVDVVVEAVELGAADEEAGSSSAVVGEEEGGRERKRA